MPKKADTVDHDGVKQVNLKCNFRNGGINGRCGGSGWCWEGKTGNPFGGGCGCGAACWDIRWMKQNIREKLVAQQETDIKKVETAKSRMGVLCEEMKFAEKKLC